MDGPFCIHCGQAHGSDALYCARTGKALAPAAAAVPAGPPPVAASVPAATAAAAPTPSPAPAPARGGASPAPPAPSAAAHGGTATRAATAATPDRGVGALLMDALRLYRRHAGPLLVTCAVVFAPASFVKSCAVARLTGPLTKKVDEAVHRVTPAAKNAMAAVTGYEDAIKDGEIDVRMLDQLEKAQADSSSLLRGEVDQLKSWLGAELTSIVWRLAITMLALLLMYGLVVPAVAGAVTLVAVDRLTGGHATPGQAWTILGKRYGALFGALFVADIFMLAGAVLFVFPAVFFWFLFAFVAPVALVEGLGGTAALKRSAALVASDWIRVVLVVSVFGILDWSAHALGGLLVPSTATLAAGLLGDLLNLVILPFPILGTVMLYLDIRRREGVDDAALRAALPLPRPVPGAARLR